MTPTLEEAVSVVHLEAPATPGQVIILVDDIPALIRDAERFRKLEAQHDGCTGAQWCSRYGTVYYASSSTLADIADALPALTDGKRRNDGHS